MKLNKKETEKIIRFANDGKINKADEIVQIYYPDGFISGCATEFAIYKNKLEIVESLVWNIKLNCYQSIQNKENLYL